MQTLTTKKLQKEDFIDTLGFFQELGLLTVAETREVLSLFEPDFLFADSLREADSVHVHVKVEDVDKLPHAEILAQGVKAESETPGYVKYSFPGGTNLIFSSINISEDDLLADAAATPMPVMDHKGIDLRSEAPDIRATFNAIPTVAADKGWRHVGQGGGGTPVYCCHTEVEEKHWIYPDLDSARQSRPIEFAFGELVIHDSKMGCDLRPIDPAHPRASEAQAALSACSAAHSGNGAAAGEGTSYYERGDLGHFTDVGNFAKPLMDKFWAYYNATFGVDGALTKREKSLIGLAVAHSKQCPYCIDSFTNSCIDNGVTVDQMHEAVHSAAALAAGVDLVHGVQMQNVLRSRGAI